MASVLKSYDCFALRTEHERKYLQSVYRKEAGGNLIEASADAVAGNARTRFFVEASKNDAALVHVRCCYNNKYWVAVEDAGSGRRVIGSADVPMEDLSSPSCTLFAPTAVTDQGGPRIRFRHAGLKKYARMSSDDVGKPYLQLAVDQENMSDVFTVLGLSQQKELPKYIAIKELGGNYFGVRSRKDLMRKVGIPLVLSDIDDGPVLVFHTKDKGDAGVMCTVLTNDDGTVRIQSTKDGFFWKRDHRDCIIPYEGRPSPNDADTLFKVIRMDDGCIALRNVGNDKILKIRRDSMQYEYLSAEETSLSEYTQLKYDEAVKSQKIYDVKYYPEEARTYDTRIVKSLPNYIVNNGQRDSTGSISYVQKVQKEITWQTSVSEKTGFEVSVSVGTGANSPINASAGVKVNKEETSSRGKETSETEGEDTTVVHSYTVPPGQTMAVQLVATRSSSDVPYSYKQRVVLTNGDPVTSIHDDGICTVKNNYGFYVKDSSDPDEIKRMSAEKNPVL